MRSFTFCVFSAILMAAVAGCSNATPPDDADRRVGESSTSADANDPPAVIAPDDTQASSKTAGSSGGAKLESGVLKRAMIAVVQDLLEMQRPGTEPDAAREQVESAIIEIRKDLPDFLMVSPETEEKLQAGAPIEGVDDRIAGAERVLNGYGLQLSGLVQSLLPQHKAGSLDPVRTELLAHLIVTDMKMAQRALAE